MLMCPLDAPPRSTVIVPHTASPLVAVAVNRICAQTLDPDSFEVLVAGPGRPPDLTNDPRVHYLETAHTEAADKRNLAMGRARGRLLFFTDDDCLPESTWMARLSARIDDGEDVVGGSVVLPEGNRLQLADNVSAFHDILDYTGAGARDYLTTANLCVRREVVDRVGPMPGGRSRAEDLEWTVRFRECGYRLAFEPTARVIHDPDRTDFRRFLRHWTNDAPHTLRVRLRHAGALSTPALAHRRWAFLVLAPWIAAWATARTYRHPETRRRYWRVLPLVLLSKLAWCWAAWKSFPEPGELDATADSHPESTTEPPWNRASRLPAREVAEQ